MKKIFLLDNKDSFTYNLVHYLEGMDLEVIVRRNDDPVASWPEDFDGLVLSPGPGLPQESGTLMEAISKYWGKVPILGVCLGHQAIALHSGGQLMQLNRVFHGVTQKIKIHVKTPLFEEIEDDIDVGLYHSWAIDPQFLPRDFIVNAKSESVIMGIQHQHLPIFGIQFHPESIMTTSGFKILSNWLKFSGKSLSLTQKEDDFINYE